MATEDTGPSPSGCGKQPHESIAAAQRHLQAMEAHARVTGRPHFGRGPFVYRCTGCGFLHVGTRAGLTTGE